MSARPGFSAGLRSVVDGFSTLASRPALWPFALVPTLVWIALNGACVYAALSWLEPFVSRELPQATTWYGEIGTSLVAWLVTALAVFAGVFLALALAPPLSAPALERLVSDVERDLGVAPRTEIGFLREMWCGLKALAAGLSASAPALLVLLVVDVVFPPAGAVTTPLKFVIGALALAWSLFDYPLTLRGVGVRERFALFRANKAPVLGFGVAFGGLFWLPCCGVVLLPVGVVAGTRLLYRILAASPDCLPELPRPTIG